MIAASGARIVTNFSSNMHLRSGLAPIAAAHKCGCAIAVGVDGLALDEDDDVLREMRLVQMMHGGLGFQRTWTTSEFLGARHRQRPQGNRRAGNGRAGIWRTSRFRHHRSRSARPRPDHAGRRHRPSIRARQCVAAARCGCGWTNRSSATAAVPASIFLPSSRNCAESTAPTPRKLSGLQRAWPPLSASLQGWFEAHLDCR